MRISVNEIQSESKPTYEWYRAMQRCMMASSHAPGFVHPRLYIFVTNEPWRRTAVWGHRDIGGEGMDWDMEQEAGCVLETQARAGDWGGPGQSVGPTLKTGR